MNQEELMQRLIKMETESENQKGDIKNLFKKFEILDKKYNDSNLDISKILQIVENQSKDIEEIKTSIKEMSSVPTSRWNTIITGILSTIVTGIVAYVLVQFGFK